MQQEICRRHIREKDDVDFVWGHLLRLVNGFVADAEEEWSEVVRTIPPLEAQALVSDAALLAAYDAVRPYMSLADHNWLQIVVQEYLDQFDPICLLPAVGVA